MQIVHFTERPHRGLTEEEILRNGSYFTLSNSRFDPKLASEDYNSYFDEYVEAENLGFDGVALNEHHGNPFCMGSVLNIEASVLARITERVRIYLIGNPIPAHRNPLRLAEELAMIDLISGGRLVAGWVRGSGPEQFFNNVNPADNRELFQEAHDFILQAWTRPGPWRYEGNHFHYRHVNPWVLPLQRPVPPTIIPGVLSAETALWAADRSYPYLGLGAALQPSLQLWNLYADRMAERGLQAGPENYGWVIQVYVGDTKEQAERIGRKHLFAGGNSNFAKAAYTLPAGYNSPEAIKRLASAPQGGWLGISREKLDEDGSGQREIDMAAAQRKIDATYAQMRKTLMLIVGTPDDVAAKIKFVLQVLRPGTLFLMASQGDVSHEDRRRSLRLLGREVLPEVREHADSLGLNSMFEQIPGSVPLPEGQPRKAVVDEAALAHLDEVGVL
jgi:alkanesulfonate monooxygenase SsuD/methylene tetrahydromethanopterin reductase-like flavin-dependent oxidoreductase (luciferase family)